MTQGQEQRWRDALQDLIEMHDTRWLVAVKEANERVDKARKALLAEPLDSGPLVGPQPASGPSQTETEGPDMGLVGASNILWSSVEGATQSSQPSPPTL